MASVKKLTAGIAVVTGIAFAVRWLKGTTGDESDDGSPVAETS